MKQLLVIAVALTAINAQASRARMTALGNSPHLVDTQTVYTKPADIFRISGDYVAIESGATQGTIAQTAQNLNAEGMIVRTMGDAKMALSLGHQSRNASSWGLRAAAVTAALKANQQNPVEFTYGMKSGEINWAGTLVYSNYNNKVAATTAALEKESSMGLRFGANSGAWDASLGLGLTNTAQDGLGNKFTGTLGLALAAGYQMDSMYFNAAVTTSGAKEEQAVTGTEVLKATNMEYSLGVVNTHKKDGNELFYSATLASTEFKDTAGTNQTKNTTLSLPLAIGFEVEAASWLTFRSSITQNVLIHQTKNVNAAGTTTVNTDPGTNSTAVAFGAGLKFNKLTVDGTISGLTAGGQNIGTNTLLSQVGVGYWF